MSQRAATAVEPVGRAKPSNLVIHDNSLTVFIVCVLFVGGLVVFPIIKSKRIRVTPSKVVAVVIAIGICIYNGSFTFLLVLLWPLSFIWFPEYWGNFTGYIRGQYVDEKSPPILVSLMGWFFLVVFPLLFLWIASR